MAILPPIKSPDDYDDLMAYLKERSPKFYLLATFMSCTGASLVDLLTLKYRDMVGVRSYMNPKNGIFYFFDISFTTVYDTYVESLPDQSIYLFPQKAQMEKSLAAPAVSRQFAILTKEIGLPTTPIQFQKTFALNYFRRHGTLEGTHLCCPGSDKNAICTYLCISDNEYEAYISHAAVPADSSSIVGTRDYVSSLRKKMNTYLDNYIEYLSSAVHDENFEKSSALTLRKLNSTIEAATKFSNK